MSEGGSEQCKETGEPGNLTHFPTKSYSHEKRYQALLASLYCTQQKAGWELANKAKSKKLEQNLLADNEMKPH